MQRRKENSHHVALILWVNCNSNITKESFRSCGSHSQFSSLFYGVGNLVNDPKFISWISSTNRLCEVVYFSSCPGTLTCVFPSISSSSTLGQGEKNITLYSYGYQHTSMSDMTDLKDGHQWTMRLLREIKPAACKRIKASETASLCSASRVNISRDQSKETPNLRYRKKNETQESFKSSMHPPKKYSQAAGE